MEKQTQFNIWYVIIALIGIMWIRDLWVNAQSRTGRLQRVPASPLDRPDQRDRHHQQRHSGHLQAGTAGWTDALRHSAGGC